jgi:SAM-dependent methyltransferase
MRMAGFSKEWELLYQADMHGSVWPWSDLVSYVHRYARPENGFRSVLELGCGAGANIPFFISLGSDYFAVDGSAIAVARLAERFPQLKDKIAVGDFTQAIPFSGPFDLVVDRSSITCNGTASIQSALFLVSKALRSGGKLIGVDWFSSSHSGAASGDRLDTHTRTNIPSGHLAGVGAVHFSDRDHLVSLLDTAGFRIERLEEKESKTIIPSDGACIGTWNFVAAKP